MVSHNSKLYNFFSAADLELAVETWERQSPYFKPKFIDR
jgi:hypothetical protein